MLISEHELTMGNVLSVGSINMDIIAMAPREAVLGETLALAEEVRFAHGGKGANAAVSSVRLGANVHMIGAVGTDPFAEALLKALAEDGINTQHILRTEGSSGIAMILVNAKSGQNTIWISTGANSRVSLPVLENISGDIFQWADVVMSPLEIPLPLVIETARRTKAAGKHFILDPAPAPLEGLPDELYALCEWISPNEGELSALSGVGGITQLTYADYADDVPAPVRLACMRLLSRGVKNVVAKLGAYGAFLLGEAGEYFIRAKTIDPVDTTAAGDAFTGAFAALLSEGKSAEEALQWGVSAGTLACTKAGAQPSIHTRAQVGAFL